MECNQLQFAQVLYLHTIWRYRASVFKFLLLNTLNPLHLFDNFRKQIHFAFFLVFSFTANQTLRKHYQYL